MPKKRYSAAFKAKVALEAIKGQRTISEIASEYEVHPAQVSQWKRQLRDGLEDVFTDPRRSGRSEEKEKDKLYQEIGRQKIELDWLKKKLQ
jgi:transposase-like protein